MYLPMNENERRGTKYEHRCQFIYFWGGHRPPIMSIFNITPMALHGKNGIKSQN